MNRSIFLVSVFRSLSTSMQNTSFASILAGDKSLFTDLLQFSTTFTEFGALATTESIEEYFVCLWDKAVTEDRDKATPAPATGNHDPPAASRGTRNSRGATSDHLDPLAGLRRLVGHREQREQDGEGATGGGRLGRDSSGDSPLPGESSLTDASPRISSANLIEMFGLSRSADPARAVQQMMEMGFPKEWCETALRRCRYNVELAINLCFEHSQDMPQFVDEDRELAASAGGSSDADRGQSIHSERIPRLGIDLERPRDTDHADIGERYMPRPSRPRPSRDSQASQLLDMGFPVSWCSRALDATQNNVDAALSWILSNSELLGSTGSGVSSDLKSSESKDDVIPIEQLELTLNPLVCVAGSASISQDLMCHAALSGGFPSIGCRGYGVSSGKWYFEVTLLTAGCIQLGWVDGEYLGDADRGQGVGDDIHSWAFDGWRLYLWHETSVDWYVIFHVLSNLLLIYICKLQGRQMVSR